MLAGLLRAFLGESVSNLTKEGDGLKFVYVCSPLRGDVERNISRASGYCRFAVKEGVLPLAPHAMFSGFLDDGIPEEREKGMALGLELLKVCSELWVIGDRISEGMEVEIKVAEQLNIPIKYFNERCEGRISNEQEFAGL